MWSLCLLPLRASLLWLMWLVAVCLLWVIARLMCASDERVLFSGGMEGPGATTPHPIPTGVLKLHSLPEPRHDEYIHCPNHVTMITFTARTTPP